MKKKEVIVNGMRISYIEKIENSTQPITLFLHGWASSKESFHQLFSEYENVIAFDFPGMGESQNFSHPATLEDFTIFFTEFLQKKVFIPIHQNKQYEIVVHSFGGRVLLKWLDMQKNNNIACNSFTFIGVPFFRNLSSAGKMQLMVSKILQNKMFSWAKPLIKKIYNTMNPQSDYVNISDEKTKKTFQNIVSEDISVFLPLLKKYNVKYIWGENDEAAPIPNMLKAKKIVPTAESFVIEKAGHFPWVDNMKDFLIALKR